MSFKLSIIAALSENRIIGEGNKIPWHIPEDLRRFKKITLNHPVIMGRKTYESIGKPLPKRANIIITRNPDYRASNIYVTSSINEAIKLAQSPQLAQFDQSEIFVIGGGEIFKQVIDLSDKLYLTIVHTKLSGDTYFPDYSRFSQVLQKETHKDYPYSFTFLTLTKRLLP